jgi:hypothetical protein
MKSGVLFGLSVALALAPNVPMSAGGKVENPETPKHRDSDRFVEYPEAEELGADEIRLTACGTGIPAQHEQAATCFLVELGDNDFFFDIGNGSMADVAAYLIPYDCSTKCSSSASILIIGAMRPPSGPATEPGAQRPAADLGPLGRESRRWAGPKRSATF